MAEETLLYITKGTERSVRSPETLSETNDLTIGQVFYTIANFYGKIKDDYPRWISFRENKSEFDIINERVMECANDIEKIHMICDWLGEEPIA